MIEVEVDRGGGLREADVNKVEGEKRWRWIQVKVDIGGG